MTEEGEMWAEHREYQRKQKQKSWDQGMAEFDGLDGFTLNVITPYQIRINGSVDVYPQSRRFFDLKQKKWGNYVKLKPFLCDIFDTAFKPWKMPNGEKSFYYS